MEPLAVTNAACTQLMDLQSCTWHEDFFPLFSVRPSMLPRICSNSEVRACAWQHDAELLGGGRGK